MAFVTVVAVAVIAVALIGVGIFTRFWEESGRPKELAIQVGEVKYNLGYYADRTRLYVGDSGSARANSLPPTTALPIVTADIIEEAVALQFAADEGITVTKDDVDTRLRAQFSVGLNTPEATPEAAQPSPESAQEQADAATRALASAVARPNTFDAIYRGELQRTGLSDKEYRDMTQAKIMISRLKDKFSAAVPAAAESIHYEQILVRDATAADDVVRRLNIGEDFATLARQLSIDTNTRDKGGDLGWVARGGLDPSSEALLFSLPVGAIQRSTSSQGIYVYKILERAASRPLDEQMKAKVGTQSYSNWLQSKLQTLTPQNNMDLTSGDPTKIRWVVQKVYG